MLYTHKTMQAIGGMPGLQYASLIGEEYPPRPHAITANYLIWNRDGGRNGEPERHGLMQCVDEPLH
jgi:hypothetical protein